MEEYAEDTENKELSKGTQIKIGYSIVSRELANPVLRFNVSKAQVRNASNTWRFQEKGQGFTRKKGLHRRLLNVKNAAKSE